MAYKKHYIFGESYSNSLETRFGVPTLAEVPLLAKLTGNFEHYTANHFIQNAVDHVVRAIGRNSLADRTPPDIQFDAKHIRLKFKDGRGLTVSNRDLRLNCQCALCVNELTGEHVLNPAQIRADIAPTQVTSLGNYAVGITWNDGHSSGIYPYKSIEALI